MQIPTDTGRTAGGWTAPGLAFAPRGDGAWWIAADSLEIGELRCEQGGLALLVARTRLKGVSALLQPAPHGGGMPQPARIEAAEVELLGVEIKSAEPSRAVVPEAGAWRLDALGGLQGFIHAFVTDAVWRVDAEVRLAIERGEIDFNRVTVEHIGPDSAMGIGRGGVYVDSPSLGREYLYLFTAQQIPGARFEARGAGRQRGVTDRGRLDLRAFAEGLLSQPAFTLPGKMADRHVESTLDRTRLTGEVQLGDGVLGTERHHLTFSGHAQGKNRMIVSAAVLSHKLVLRLPDVQASAARFEWQGRQAACGAVSADASVRMSGLGNGRRPEITLGFGHLRVERLQWGDPEAR